MTTLVIAITIVVVALALGFNMGYNARKKEEHKATEDGAVCQE